MPHYNVISPEIHTTIPILDDGSGPEEHFCCFVSVDAPNEREAKILALKDALMRDWVQWARDENKNPFSGLIVENPVCNHGVCWCDICKQECEECYKPQVRTTVSLYAGNLRVESLSLSLLQ